MIQTYSTTIRRKEMDAVLTCMVDERIGPGELNSRLIQSVKEFTGCDGAIALRSPLSALMPAPVRTTHFFMVCSLLIYLSAAAYVSDS